jgi:hypothetical protein
MRKMIALVILFFFISKVALCQVGPNASYLQKSKAQKRAAWIYLGGGLVTSVVGLSLINLAGSADGDVNNTPGAILFFSGVTATIISIPMFALATKNKRKAVAVNIITEHVPVMTLKRVREKSHPAVAVRISF